MTISVEPLTLSLKRPFRIAHGTSTERNNAVVRLADGVGEAALPPYYPTRVEDVEHYVHTLDFPAGLESGEFAIESVLAGLPPGPAPAMAAVDMALFDVWSSKMERPLYRILGLDPAGIPTSSMALSIPRDESEWRETLAAYRAYPVLKLKLGSGDTDFDEAVVRIAREMHGGRLSVDANGAWSIPEAVEIIPRLAAHDLDFVEQPIAAGDIDDWHLLRRLLPHPGVPLLADESVHTTEDVLDLSGAADGVNVKLAKCGGIRGSIGLITMARALDMKVLLGCMIESSLALTAAAHIAALADFVDLDAIEHLASDPYVGLSFVRGEIRLPDRPGLGVQASQE